MDSPWSGASRMLAIFIAGLLVGAFSIGHIAPASFGTGGGTVAMPGADGDLVPLDSAMNGTTGPAGGTSGNDASVGIGRSGGTAGPSGGSGTTGTSDTSATSGGDGTGGGSTGGGGSDGDGSDGGGSDGDGSDGGGASQLSCDRSGNGGTTDTGVTSNSILMATTVVESGVGAAFLADVKWGMEAVRQKVNSQGGICGRVLDIEYRDDGWDSAEGKRWLETFIRQDGVFAIPVGPSSEGLNAAIEDGLFDQTGTPVVGTDGLIIAQYECTDGQTGCEAGAAQQWVWPVASATVSNARIIAQAAVDRYGADGDFSIVFDRNFRFGREAARAFNAQIRKLTGDDVDGFNEDLTCVRAFCGIEAEQRGYRSQVQAWRGHAGDFTALFLEPETALKWMKDANTPGARHHPYGASQTLFTREGFAIPCETRCDQMAVWTGFKPFQEEFRNDQAVRAYVNDLRSVNPNADELNQFVEGGYVGMQLLVEALEQVGPNLTQERLKATLDGMEFSCGLCLDDTLAYSPTNRYVNNAMQEWTIGYSQSFGGFNKGRVVSDPCPTGGIGTC